MYNDDYDRSGDEIYSKPVRAGKRTYFFDVKSTKGNNDFYLTITESKRKSSRTDVTSTTNIRFSFIRRISRSLQKDSKMQSSTLRQDLMEHLRLPSRESPHLRMSRYLQRTKIFSNPILLENRPNG